MRFNLTLNKAGKNDPLAGAIIGAVLVGLFLIGFFIYVARQFFPFFFIMSLISLLVLIGCIAKDIFFREEYDDLWFIYPLVAFGIFLFLTLITLGIGYGFSETDLGKAGMSIYELFGTVNEIQQNVTETLYNDIPKQILNETCKDLNNSLDCNIIESSIDTLNTAREVSDTFK